MTTIAYCAGFLTCAVIFVRYPVAAAFIHERTVRLIAWFRRTFFSNGKPQA